MRAFKKSDVLLIIGFIYSIIVAVLACIGAGYCFYTLTQVNGGEAGDPLFALFLGVAVLIGWLFCLLGGVLCVAIATMSILSSVNAMKAMEKHKRRNYKCCKIFGMISINPFYMIGASMGLSIWHKIDEAKAFLRS